MGNGEFVVEGLMRGQQLVTKNEERDRVKLSEWRAMETGNPPVITIPTTRSLGDHRFKTCPIPIVSCTKIPEKGCQLLVLTDGISDVASGNQLKEFIQESPENDIETINHQLHQKAANMRGGDDKTSVLVKIQPKQ